jgi:23S rRNA pseudouridine2605 synthase
MRDRPHPNHKLEWPGGVVPEWAKPQQNLKRRGGKGPKGGHERQGGSSPSKRERLQKVMAQSGHGSRRNIEILIAQGHITINGQVAKLGDSVGPGDKVKMDGHLLRLRYGEPLPRVLMYHKPEGEIVTRDDPEGRATVFEKLPRVNGGRWVSVGRLDLNTGGLLIFTTSGELANRLTHPRFEVEREYAVRVMGEIDEEKSKQLLSGVEIEGEVCKFDSIEDRGGEGSNHWYHVVLREGKNREVRKMCEAVSLTVSRLMRVRFGEVALPTFLKRGMMKELNEEEVQVLLGFAGMNEPLPGEKEGEVVEDEHDSIGNRDPQPGRNARGIREIDESRDNIGNRAPEHERRAARAAAIDDDLGNRFDPSHQRPEPREGNVAGRDPGPRPDIGNRGEYGSPRGAPGARAPRPGQQQRRPHGAKPFFNKKRGPGGHGNVQAGQGEGHPQPQGQGQPHGQGKHQQHRRKHNKPHGPQGQGQPHVQGPAQPGQPQAQGGQGQPAGPGTGKPGRNRRNKNKNRNRGGGGQPAGAPQPVTSGGGETS